MSTDNFLAAEKASSEELIELARKFERLDAWRKMVDEVSEEPGMGAVTLTGREIELIAGCVRAVGGKAWREGR